MQQFSYKSDANVDIPRNALILDTNILVGAFHEGDEHHEESVKLVHAYPNEFVIFVSVIVEACGVLKGRPRGKESRVKLISWLRDKAPGSVLIIPDLKEPFEGHVQDTISQNSSLDCVDAMIAFFADRTFSKEGLEKPVAIATHDKKDYLALSVMHSCKIRLFDFNTYRSEPFG